MKVWVAMLENLLGVYSTKEKAVNACIKWADNNWAKILEFDEDEDGFSILVRFDEGTPQECCARYYVAIAYVDGFDYLED